MNNYSLYGEKNNEGMTFWRKIKDYKYYAKILEKIF